MNKLLSINNLSKTYHTLKGETKAIDNISFDLYKGEILSIIGPSGCGKSTILNIIDLLDKEYSGKIEFFSNINIGYMTQESNLFSHLSVRDNALLGLKVQNKMNDESIKYTDYLLDKYGLSKFKNSKVSDLSGGMKQRLSLIRTLSIKPDLILLDEAFSALDYVTRLRVSDDVYKIIKTENITALMVTHDIEEAISMSDRVIVLSNRPSTIKHVYSANYYNKTTPIDNRNSKDFLSLYELIWKDFDKNE